MVDSEHAVFICRPDLLHLEHPYRQLNNEAVCTPLNQHLEERDGNGVHETCNEWYTSLSTNHSVLPDNLLLSVTPVFLIRNPILMIPSFCRTITPEEITPAKLAVTTLLWSRRMYEWYVAKDPRFAVSTGERPLVINSADFMASSAGREQIAVAMGLDPKKVLSSWSAMTEEEKAAESKTSVRMGKTLQSSTHLMAEKAAVGDEGWERWKAEFGEEKASILKEVVDEETFHWEFLKSKAWVAS